VEDLEIIKGLLRLLFKNLFVATVYKNAAKA